MTVAVTDDADRQVTGSIEIEITAESDEEREDEFEEDAEVPDEESDSARNATGSQISQTRTNSTGEE